MASTLSVVVTILIAPRGKMLSRVYRRGVRGLSSPASVRGLSSKAHTLLSPTPELLQEYLGAHPSDRSTVLYLLSTSIDTALLQPLIATLQSTSDQSLGSFSVSPPGGESSLSIVTLTPEQGESIYAFRTAMSGRPDAQVGRYQRPGNDNDEDKKGSVVGEVERLKEGEGWSGFWKGERTVNPIPELDGVK